MGLDMIDTDEGLAEGPCEGLGRGDADEEGADEAGAVADCDGVDHAKAEPGLRERLADHGDDGFDVGAACDLGDDAGVLLVQRVLAGDDAGADTHARLHDGGGGLIAGRFDAEDEDARAPGKEDSPQRHRERRGERDWGLGTGHWDQTKTERGESREERRPRR